MLSAQIHPRTAAHGERRKRASSPSRSSSLCFPTTVCLRPAPMNFSFDQLDVRQSIRKTPTSQCTAGARPLLALHPPTACTLPLATRAPARRHRAAESFPALPHMPGCPRRSALAAARARARDPCVFVDLKAANFGSGWRCAACEERNPNDPRFPDTFGTNNSGEEDDDSTGIDV